MFSARPANKAEVYPALPVAFAAFNALSSALALRSLFSLTMLPRVSSFTFLRKLRVFNGPCRASISLRRGDSDRAIAIVIAS